MSALLIRALLKNRKGTEVQEIRGKLQEAAALGVKGRFAAMRSLGDQLVRGTNEVALLLDIGALLSSYGFLTDAHACYEKAQALAPTDLRATINLANLARDAGSHTDARRLYAELLPQLPDHPVA